MTKISHSTEQTEALAAAIANIAQPGDFIALRGDLGAGKTAFVRGFVRAMGYGYASSPTFAIVHEYETHPMVFHMDLYRLDGAVDLFDMGYEEYAERKGIVLMEWPERAESMLPVNRLEITIRYGENDPDERRIEITPFGSWVERISEEI